MFTTDSITVLNWNSFDGKLLDWAPLVAVVVVLVLLLVVVIVVVVVLVLVLLFVWFNLVPSVSATF